MFATVQVSTRSSYPNPLSIAETSAMKKSLTPPLVTGGASGAATMRIDAGERYFVKHDPRRIHHELNGQRIMKQLLPQHTLPVLEYDESNGRLCFPYLDYDLDTAVKKALLPQLTIVQLYDDFLQKMMRLWITSRSTEKPSAGTFSQRLIAKKATLQQRYPTSFAGLSVGFSALSRMEIELNGIRYPSLEDMSELAQEIICKNVAPVSVTAHRDEHAKNLMIRPAGDTSRPQWMLVDFPGVQAKSDWVWSIVKMRSWWQAGTVIDTLKQQPQQDTRAVSGMEIADRRLKINYDLQRIRPAIGHTLDTHVGETAAQVGHLFQDDGWQQRYGALMFHFYTCLLAHYAPQHTIVPILLGEAAKAFRAFVIDGEGGDLLA